MHMLTSTSLARSGPAKRADETMRQYLAAIFANKKVFKISMNNGKKMTALSKYSSTC